MIASLPQQRLSNGNEDNPRPLTHSGLSGILEFTDTHGVSCCPCSHHEMQNQRDNGQYEQQVNESARDVQYPETADPRDQQDHKQYRPDAHSLS
jgi:hypothetical protein